jgi:hypothetical protein
MRLIFCNGEGKVPRHAQGGFQNIAVHASHLCRPQRGRVGKRRFEAAVGDPQTRSTAAHAAPPRPPVLDTPDEDVDKMEIGARHCATRYCCELAAAAIQALLVEAVPEEGTGTAEGLCRTPEAGPNNGGG